MKIYIYQVNQVEIVRFFKEFYFYKKVYWMVFVKLQFFEDIKVVFYFRNFNLWYRSVFEILGEILEYLCVYSLKEKLFWFVLSKGCEKSNFIVLRYWIKNVFRKSVR